MVERIMRLVFIRHTSVAVERGVCYGQSDVPVAGTFETEAETIKKRLETYRFDRIYSSPLSRCMKLAAYCGYHNPETDSRLLEMNFGEWEMKRFDEISDPRLRLWYDDYLNVRATGGESAMEQRARLESFISDLCSICDSDETIAIFCHGGIMIHAMAIIGRIDYAEAFRHLPDYGAISEWHI